jgi:hypothetical protein
MRLFIVSTVGVHSRSPVSRFPSGESVRDFHHVPPLRFLTSSTVCASDRVQMCFNLLPILGLTAFPVAAKPHSRSGRFLPFEAFPPLVATKIRVAAHFRGGMSGRGSLRNPPSPSPFPSRPWPGPRLHARPTGPQGFAPRSGSVAVPTVSSRSARCSPGLGQRSTATCVVEKPAERQDSSYEGSFGSTFPVFPVSQPL